MLAALAVPGLLLIGVIALAPIAWLFWLSFRERLGLHARRTTSACCTRPTP